MMAESQPQMAGGTVESRDERHLFPMLGATTIVLLIAACKLVVHLYAGHRYGYLGDELYFLACSRHLAWGYVDQPPLIAMIAWAGLRLVSTTAFEMLVIIPTPQCRSSLSLAGT